MERGNRLGNNRTVVGSKTWLIKVYLEQLDKFEKIGMGNETEFGVTITEHLINTTKKRLNEISIVQAYYSQTGSK
tara:strand:+ start:69 stop:293 length:225 start_codon:yes stop_codon:yes gene_type:complete